MSSSEHHLALLYTHGSEYAKAEPLYRRALAMRENALGPDHPLVAGCLNNYADLLDALNQPERAAELRARASTITAQQNPTA